MYRKFTFEVGENYHIYHRGNGKQEIFLEDADYSRFIILLYLSNSVTPIHLSDFRGKNFSEFFEIPIREKLVNIGAYCLMPNHYHLLLTPIKEGGVSLFISKLATAYAMYFKIKYKRSGSIFEGPFRAKHLNTDEYLRYIFAYIHLNPVKIKIGQEDWAEKIIPNVKIAKQFLQKYRFSSYLDYTDKKRVIGKILNKGAFPEYFDTVKDFESYTNDWIMYSSEEDESPPIVKDSP